MHRGAQINKWRIRRNSTDELVKCMCLLDRIHRNAYHCRADLKGALIRQLNLIERVCWILPYQFWGFTQATFPIFYETYNSDLIIKGICRSAQFQMGFLIDRLKDHRFQIEGQYDHLVVLCDHIDVWWAATMELIRGSGI